MPDVSGSQQLALKAGTRRARVAIFGGSLNKKTGRRGRGGAQFNRGKGTPFQQAQQSIRDAAKRTRAKPVSVATNDQFFDDDDGGEGDGGDDDDGF